MFRTVKISNGLRGFMLQPRLENRLMNLPVCQGPRKSFLNARTDAHTSDRCTPTVFPAREKAIEVKQGDIRNRKPGVNRSEELQYRFGPPLDLLRGLSGFSIIYCRRLLSVRVCEANRS